MGRAHAPPALDRAAAAWLSDHRIDAIDPAWRTAALVGGSIVLGSVVLAGAAVAWRTGERRVVAFICCSYAGAELLFWTIKVLVDRPRPPASLSIATAGSASFPSGHTAVATAVALSLLIAARSTGHALRHGAAVWAIALPLVVGVSRLALGVHWVTDVVGGALIGAGWVLLCAALLLSQEVTSSRTGADPGRRAAAGASSGIRATPR